MKGIKEEKPAAGEDRNVNQFSLEDDGEKVYIKE